jgi:hypothetical protein
MSKDYKLANRTRQALKGHQLRQDILASAPEKALDMILEAPSPATLTQSFPDQDLYFLMHRIGVHDFLPVLAMASSDQWEYILDVEAWDDDRMDLNTMAQALALLFKADPKRLLRWGIMKKPEFMEFFLFHHIQMVIREHDDPPPSDFEDYITLDDKFYFRFPDKKISREDDGQELLPGDTPHEGQAHDEAPELIESMLKTLAEMDLSVFHGLLLETAALLPAEAEEEEYRLRNIRLAEKGFAPPHEAIGIYQPPAAPRKRPARLSGSQALDPDQPMPPQFFARFIQGELLFVQALDRVRQRQAAGTAPAISDLHNELAALINKIISADRLKIRKSKDIQGAMEKAGAYLSLGLEAMGGTEPEAAADIICTAYIEDIFRTGSREGIRLKTRAMAWYETSFLKHSTLPLSFLGESYLGVLGGLFIQRPMFFSNYAEKVLYRHFRSLKDIRSTWRLLDEILALDDFLKVLNPDLSTFTHGVLTYKSMILTLWLKAATGSAKELTPDPSLAPVSLDRFIPFFSDLFSGGNPGRIDEAKAESLARWAGEVMGQAPDNLAAPLQATLFSLIHELEEDYGAVSPDRVDPRFMPHFLLAGGPKESIDGIGDGGAD